ncbi:hypothetical protein MKX01_017501 [Papaver californicum]|nr:hypothetical protein MKX01_017501 [Papaver californicum]
MVKSSTNSSGKNGEGSSYKGVRMRKWGKWVSEIRVPKSRDKIWLGSYLTPEKAAKAYDAAVFCIRGGGGGLYNLNFPQDRSALETMLLTTSNASSSSSSSSTIALHHCDRFFPSHLTRSQIQLVASKYANSTNDVEAVARALPQNSLDMSSALPVPNANLSLQTNSLIMSSALPAANMNLVNSWPGEDVVALSPSESLESSVLNKWHLGSDVLGYNHFYGQEFYAGRGNHFSQGVAAIEGQGGEELLEDAIAPHGTSGDGSNCSDNGNDDGLFY